MINFRYHVVSLTAVFLALAIGLVVGTTALNGPAAEELGDQVTKISNQSERYREEIEQYQEQAQRQEQFVTDSTAHMLGAKLSGRRVLIVTTSDADKKYVDGMLQTLTVGGVKVTGRVSIGSKFTEPASNESLLGIADSALPLGVTGLPTNSVGPETAAALLAAVLVDRQNPVSADDRRKVVAAFKDYLVVTPDLNSSAEAVLLLAGAPYDDRDATKMNAALVRLVEQFDKAGALVVAGNGVGGSGNLIGAVRGDPALAGKVSTVDNVATPQGRVVAALALIDQLAGKPGGHYGTGPGATDLLPKAPVDRERNG